MVQLRTSCLPKVARCNQRHPQANTGTVSIVQMLENLHNKIHSLISQELAVENSCKYDSPGYHTKVLEIQGAKTVAIMCRSYHSKVNFSS